MRVKRLRVHFIFLSLEAGAWKEGPIILTLSTLIYRFTFAIYPHKILFKDRKIIRMVGSTWSKVTYTF